MRFFFCKFLVICPSQSSPNISFLSLNFKAFENKITILELEIENRLTIW